MTHDHACCAASPARAIRQRFPDAIVARLARIAWWDWPDATLFARLPDFQSDAIEAFCERYDPARAGDAAQQA